ncbi:hypothetical protein GCM10028806_44230 [Spirosoma terrae]|uniref:MFS transporter n=1 Tax=Spirosoma terrae TaxID=1968276 RepID=A0A6L9LAQ3_9BACT|nr:MFS transporter [Spirosoma terrae]NDU93909.1 MFS transporter [Spirosoma terrae]
MDVISRLSAGGSRYQRIVLALGVGHGFSDAAAGYLIGSLSQQSDFFQIGSAVLLYNALAFGGQLPAGVWIDRLGHYRSPAILSLLGMLLALGLLYYQLIWISVGLAGISSAFFHAAGGATTLVCFPGKAQFVGLFSAFGVLGLALGGWAGATQVSWFCYVVVAGLSMVLVVLLNATFPLGQRLNRSIERRSLDRHDYLMIVLLMAIALRSAVWNCLQLIYSHQYEWLFYMAIAAMVGKVVGGWLTDRISWKVYALIALTVAIPALSWGHRKLVWLLLGTGLLQSLTPMSVLAWQRIYPNRPAAVSGLSFGLAIAIGGLVSVSPLAMSGSVLAQLLLMGLLTAGLYYVFLRLFRHDSVFDR